MKFLVPTCYNGVHKTYISVRLKQGKRIASGCWGEYDFCGVYQHTTLTLTL